MFRKITAYTLILAMAAASLSACEPKYVSPLEDPTKLTVSADQVIDIDFVQVHNEIVDELSDEKIGGIIKNINIDGKNDPKELDVELTVTEDATDEQITAAMSTILEICASEIEVEDNRFTSPEETEDQNSYGDVYDTFAISYSITKGDAVSDSGNIPAGSEIKFPRSASIY